MAMCPFHPSEPGDRVCAPCLHERLRYLSRKEGTIRRHGETLYVRTYNDEAERSDAMDGKESDDFGSEVTAELGESGTISHLIKSESQRSQHDSASHQTFHSCGSEVSGNETDSRFGPANARSRKQDQSSSFDTHTAPCSRNCVNDWDKHSCSSPPYSTHASHMYRSDVEINPEDGSETTSAGPVSISALISLSMRESDGKFRKSCNFSQTLPDKVQKDQKTRSSSYRESNFRPVWKLKLLPKSASHAWRVCFQNPLKSSKVSPGKREADPDTTFPLKLSSRRGSRSEVRRQASRSSSLRRPVRRPFVPPPPDAVTFACPTPSMRTFRRGKHGVCKGADSSRRTTGPEQGERRGSRFKVLTAGVSQPVFDQSNWKEFVDAINSDIAAATSNSLVRENPEQLLPMQLNAPKDRRLGAHQSKLDSHILTWMDGAVTVHE